MDVVSASFEPFDYVSAIKRLQCRRGMYELTIDRTDLQFYRCHRKYTRNVRNLVENKRYLVQLFLTSWQRYIRHTLPLSPNLSVSMFTAASTGYGGVTAWASAIIHDDVRKERLHGLGSWWRFVLDIKTTFVFWVLLCALNKPADEKKGTNNGEAVPSMI